MPVCPASSQPPALGYYLRVGAVPAPLTMFEDVRVVPPCHRLVLLKREGGGMVTRCTSDRHQDRWFER